MVAVFDFKVTINDVKQFKPNFVQKIFVHFIRDCGANIEQIHQLPFDICDAVQQYPEEHRDVMRKIALARVVHWLFSTIYDDESFMPADLFDPKQRRTRRFFTLLLDYVYACNEDTELFNSIKEQVTIKHEAKMMQCENIEKFKEKIEQMKMEDAENQIREEQELERIGVVKIRLQGYQETKVDLRSQVEDLKMAISTIVTTIKDAELEVIEGKEKVEKLASLVVQPSEYQEIEEREHKLSSYKNENQGKSEHLTELKQAINVFKMAIQLLNSQLLVLVQETKQEVMKKNECMDDISRQERSLASYLEEAEDKTMQDQHLNELLVSKEGKVSQMHQAWNLKRMSILEEINQHKLILQEMRHNQTEDEIVSQDLEIERLKIIKENQEFNEQIMNMDHFVASGYKKILDAMEKHNSELQVTFADLAQCIEERIRKD